MVRFSESRLRTSWAASDLASVDLLDGLGEGNLDAEASTEDRRRRSCPVENKDRHRSVPAKYA